MADAKTERPIPEARSSMGKDDPTGKPKSATKAPDMGVVNENAIPQQSEPEGMKSGEMAIDPLGCTWGSSQPGCVVRHAVPK